MKKLLFISSSLFMLSNYIFSQDTITTQSNKVILAKISEVTGTSIRYKQFDMPDGPDFIVSKSTIKKIVYKNGTVENMEPQPVIVKTEPTPTPAAPQEPAVVPNSKFIKFDKKYTYEGRVVGEGRMYKIMDKRNDVELYSITKKAKKAKGLQFIGFAAIPAAAFAAESFLIATVFSNQAAEPFVDSDLIIVGTVASAATVGLAATGLIFNMRHKKLKAKAVRFYNEKY